MNDREPGPRPGPSTGRQDRAFMPHRVFAGLEPPYSDPEQARTVIVPVPYDGTSEWQSGSRHGPQAIIDASQYLELYDLESGHDIYKTGIYTLTDVEPALGSPEDMIERVYQVSKQWIEKEKFIVMLGGEHSLSLGPVRAFKEAFPELSVLQLDAHADLRDEYLGTRYGQACVMRRIVELCPISQVGIRSLSREEMQFLTQSNLRPFYMSDLSSDTSYTSRIVSSLTRDVYITIDADVMDPSIMSAVGLPEPDGITWQQVLQIVQSVARHRRVVGFDLVELCPGAGPRSCAFLLAKLAYQLIGHTVSQVTR